MAGGTFPTALPTYTITAGSESANTAGGGTGLSPLLNQLESDVTALATKMGTGASTASAGKVLRASGTGTSTWGAVVLTTDVTGTLPVANGGTGQSTLATFLGLIYPVGCIYSETTGTNPNTTFGFGTWTAFGAGRVLVGNGTSDQAFAAGATGGESTHILTIAEMPAHTHPDNFNFAVGAAAPGGAVGSGTNAAPASPTGSTGGGGSHNNLQPYIVVYFWKRTA